MNPPTQPSATPRTDAQVAFENPAGVPGDTSRVCTYFARTLETELAEAKELAERYRLHTLKQDAELARLCAEVEAFKNNNRYMRGHSAGYAEANDNCEAELLRMATRAERAEAALAEWSVLNLWGGTPEIIHEFIKGQQNRIHYCQNLEEDLAAARKDSERLNNALKFICHNGGMTFDTEVGPIECTGFWCAEQARAAMTTSNHKTT